MPGWACWRQSQQMSASQVGQGNEADLGVPMPESMRCFDLVLACWGTSLSGMKAEQTGMGQYVGFVVHHSSYFDLKSATSSASRYGFAWWRLIGAQQRGGMRETSLLASMNAFLTHEVHQML
jgi:hypothetical protein